MSIQYLYELNDMYDFENMYETAYNEYVLQLMRQANLSYNPSLPF